MGEGEALQIPLYFYGSRGRSKKSDLVKRPFDSIPFTFPIEPRARNDLDRKIVSFARM